VEALNLFSSIETLGVFFNVLGLFGVQKMAHKFGQVTTADRDLGGGEG
jgi:hypothetical protein